MAKINSRPSTFGHIDESGRCIIAKIPASKTGSIQIIESHGAKGGAKIVLAEIRRDVWSAVDRIVEDHFNSILARYNCKQGCFDSSSVHMIQQLGRSLAVLAWAIEDASPEEAVRAAMEWVRQYDTHDHNSDNFVEGTYMSIWLEVRDAVDPKTGWRMAVKHMFTDNRMAA